ncbi:hypothetical protein NE237_017206 [Protea cynaroides]|uniref:RABX5 catalytic core helical domain-containing protein n=1 Tax=Protea cynaroides TaxID=273540 RepID=A0A9Q0K7K9_9MAGN|nr:hypothetical protein NE237_017206 [Protea cynaroides]
MVSSIECAILLRSISFAPSKASVNSENDSKRLQDFLSTMETNIRDHPLWSGASEEEIDCAIEGLEKYVMTKLSARTFASSQEDTKVDQEISEKIHLFQKFVRPEHLDIPEALHNEASWLVNSPQLFRRQSRQSKLISEVAYYFTNLMSAKSFIVDLDGKSLSMEEAKFQENMLAARLEFQMNMLPERLTKGQTETDLSPKLVTARSTGEPLLLMREIILSWKPCLEI